MSISLEFISLRGISENSSCVIKSESATQLLNSNLQENFYDTRKVEVLINFLLCLLNDYILKNSLNYSICDHQTIGCIYRGKPLLIKYPGSVLKVISSVYPNLQLESFQTPIGVKQISIIQQRQKMQ